jgi:hypothetical protein
MDETYIKMLRMFLFTTLAVSLCKPFPEMFIVLDNEIINTLILCLLILTMYFDPLSTALIICCIIVNTHSAKIEETTMNTTTQQHDFFYPKQIIMGEDSRKKTKPIVAEETSQETSEETSQETSEETAGEITEDMTAFIISESMLESVQNNIFSKKNMNLFPNEIRDIRANAQGVFAGIIGYNI